MFRTCILHNFRFNQISDVVNYENFRIVQGSENPFKTFKFLMENWQFEESLNARSNIVFPENACTSHQHGFGNVVKDQYWLVSRRSLCLVGDHFFIITKFAIVFESYCKTERGVDFIQCWQDFRGRWNTAHFSEGIVDIAVAESRHLVLVCQLFFDIAHKCICHEWPEGRAHSNPVHVFVEISFESKKLVLCSNL